ncbi:MAG: DUF839 domain-containing protein [Microthrixaceae bacterium]|nr:DUF839 domain-containing protein [Microthrixaceae bacterium]
MQRRQFLANGAFGVGAVVVAPGVWRAAKDQVAVPGTGPYGSIEAAVPDANGLLLPEGFTSRVIATSDQAVGDTGYTWHVFPDGGATFATDDDGWIYVSNSEAVLPGTGGVSAVRFDSGGEITDAYRILGDTAINCAGGSTPWGTWLSCEEFDWHGNASATAAFGSVAGRVYETDPTGVAEARVLPAMGLFQHEAAAVDPVHEVVYLTEDQADGRLYRYTPTSYPDLGSGTLEAAVIDGEQVSWVGVPDPSAADLPTKDQVPGATVFAGGEGIWYSEGTVVFTTKRDNRVHAIDTAAQTYRVIYDAEVAQGAALRGVDNITVEEGSGDLFVAEDGDDMQVVIITPEGEVAPFAQVTGHENSEITGPAFSPDGTRLYFSSQRGTDGNGITYEVTGPFRGAQVEDPDASTTTVVASLDAAASAGDGGDPPEEDPVSERDDGPPMALFGALAAGAVVAAGAALAARRNRPEGEGQSTDDPESSGEPGSGEPGSGEPDSGTTDPREKKR